MHKEEHEPLPGDNERKTNRILGRRRRFHIVVCDGRELDRRLLCKELEQFFWKRNENAAIVEYTNGRTLLSDIEERYVFPEILFLDVYLNGMNGMELAQRLQKLGYKGHIIFVTASKEYAIESYDVHASGYLLKPIQPSKFQFLMEHVVPAAEKNHIVIHSGRNNQELIEVDSITYAESCAHMLMIHLTDGSVLETREKLDVFEKILDDRRFLRCHQSFLVNMDFIMDAQKDFRLYDGSIVIQALAG